jgi:MFS family permease
MKLIIPPALKHRRYFYLWFGLLISLAGSRMQMAAVLWQISEISKSPKALGMLGLMHVIPLILFSLPAGIVADRFNRRKIIFITQSVMMLQAFALMYLTIRGGITLTHIYGLTVIVSIALAFDMPARQSIVPTLVPKKDLPNAFSMSFIAYQTGAIVGPAIGGFVIAAYGLSTTYLINGLSFITLFAALIVMGNVVSESKVKRPEINLDEIKEGIKFTFGNRIILGAMLLDFMATLFTRSDTLMPIFATTILNVGVKQYGWLLSAQAIGGALAGLVLSQIKSLKNQGKILIMSITMIGAGTIVFGTSRNFYLSMIALVIVGASDSVSTVIRNTLRQLATPDHLRGRMTSINQIFFSGGPHLGEFEAGMVGEWLGVQMAAITGGIACILGVQYIAKKFPILANLDSEDDISLVNV